MTITIEFTAREFRNLKSALNRASISMKDQADTEVLPCDRELFSSWAHELDQLWCKVYRAGRYEGID